VITAVKRLVLRYAPPGLLLNFKKIHYLRAIRAFSESEERDLIVVKRLVQRGDLVVDVGANVGWYTRVLSELVGAEGQVVAIEPISETFELLSFCMRRLRLTNVTLLNCAASDRDGRSPMCVPQYEAGGFNFYRARVVDKPDIEERAKGYEIALRSLDSLFDDKPHAVRFIKCDVEGHELQVVRGATGIINKFRPAWLIEESGDPDSENSSFYQVVHTFRQWGYSVWMLDGCRLRRRRTGDRSINYVMLTEVHKDLVKDLLSE
jgi:FkbM family methyltransferase